MTSRHDYHICLVLFGALMLTSAYGYLCPQSPEPELIVAEPEQTLPELIVDREYVIDFHVYNRGSRTLRVVGAEYT